MKKKQIRRMLRKAFQTAGADKVIGTYLVVFFACALPIWLIEPGIHSYADSLWFCFASATSIGYGDMAAVTPAGRIITVVLALYSVAVIAIVTAVITSFFTDLARFRANESVREFVDELEHLPELSKEELENLSQRVRDFQKKR